LSWLVGAAPPELEPASEYAPARVPVFVFVIVPEPVTESPIFTAEALKMAPEPVRVMESEPEAKALDEIVVGVAVKLATVLPTPRRRSQR